MYYLDVLLPFHVNDSFLTAAIESCMKALPKNSRLLMINTLSEEKILQDHSERFIELNYPNANYMSALMLGMANSNSEYIALMNSDDLIDVDRFFKQIEALSSSGREICAANLSKFAIKKKSKKIKIPALLGKPPSHFHEASLLLGPYRADASWCFTSEWARKNRLFSSDGDISDWCVAMRVMNSTNTIVLDEDLYFYRIHSGQLSQNRDIHKSEKYISSWEALNNKFGFRKLSAAEIQVLTSNYGRIKTKEIESVFLWLKELQNYLVNNLPQSENQQVKNLISRRRLFICYKYRVLSLQLHDVRILGTVFLEYCKFRKFLRGEI